MTSHNGSHAEDSSASTAGSRAHNAETAPCSPRAFPIREFCRRYGIGRTVAYKEISAGRLRAVKVGRRTLITQEAAEAWLAMLPQVQAKRH